VIDEVRLKGRQAELASASLEGALGEGSTVIGMEQEAPNTLLTVGLVARRSGLTGGPGRLVVTGEHPGLHREPGLGVLAGRRGDCGEGRLRAC
jgi:hypothetical protein